MITQQEIRSKRGAIEALAAKYRASNVRLFGSVVRGDQHSRSDVDILVDFDPAYRFLDYTGLLEELTRLLGCRVDVVPAHLVKPGYRDEILAEAQPL